MNLPAGHGFVRIEIERGRYRLLCQCGWRSMPSPDAAPVGEAWDRHLDEATGDLGRGR